MPPPTHHLKRLALLLACFVTGLVIALVGEALTGNQAWYLAIPAIIAAGWLFVANPTECVTPPKGRKESPRLPGHEVGP